MTIIPASFTYKEFLDRVKKIEKAQWSGPDIYYNDLYELIKNKLGDQPIENYREFMSKCGNLGNLHYWDLYLKLYPENEDAKPKTGGTRKGRKSRKGRKLRRTIRSK